MFGKLVVAFSMIGALACARTNPRGPDVYGYRVHPADVDPVVLERSPQVYFRGAWAHLIDGEWYYPTESGWIVFDDVPQELQRHADSADTEQAATDMPSPRGPSVYRLPNLGSPLAAPPPKVK